MKVLSFKTVSPLFEMERDGIKPFTTRLWDGKDSRFRLINRWANSGIRNPWGIRITNPQTGESFIRELTMWSYISFPDWIILHLGKRLDEEVK